MHTSLPSTWRHLLIGVFMILCVSASTTGPAASAPDRTTPAAAMRTLVNAIEAEDEQAIADCFHVDNDPQATFAHAEAKVFIAGHQYVRAMYDRFGRQRVLEAYVKRQIALPDSWLDFPNGEWKIQGDRAISAIKKDRPHGFGPLRRVNGQWLVDLLPRAKPESITLFAHRQEIEAQKYKELAANVAAGKFSDVNQAIDVLYPPTPPEPAPPEPTKEELDPTTIPGAMKSLGLALQKQDLDAAANFYYADGPDGKSLARAHAKHLLAAMQFIEQCSQIRDSSKIASDLHLIDPVDDLFGNVLTDWKIAGDRATGTNEAGPAPATLRRVDGIWKIDLTPVAGAADAAAQAKTLEQQTQVLLGIARDVRVQRITSAEQLRAELKQRGLGPATAPAGATPAQGTVETE